MLNRFLRKSLHNSVSIIKFIVNLISILDEIERILDYLHINTIIPNYFGCYIIWNSLIIFLHVEDINYKIYD